MANGDEFEYRSVSLSVVYSSALFPFDLFEFIRQLPPLGYQTETVQIPIGGARLDARGTIARKGQMVLAADSEKQLLTFIGLVPSTLAAELRSIEDLLSQKFAFDSPNNAQYYELIVSATLPSRGKTLERWATHFDSVPILHRFSHIANAPLVPFGVRVVQTGRDPIQADWLDIRFEPLIQGLNVRQSLDIVFRRAEQRPVLEFVLNLRRIIPALNAAFNEGEEGE